MPHIGLPHFGHVYGECFIALQLGHSNIISLSVSSKLTNPSIADTYERKDKLRLLSDMSMPSHTKYVQEITFSLIFDDSLK